MKKVNNNLTVLEQREVLGADFRVYGDVDSPLFLAKDVAEWIGERDGYTLARKVDEDEKLIHTICVGGQNREVTMLTEHGFYEALMLSKSSIARAFKKEVKEILKEIRQTGGYITVREDDSEDDVIARALVMAQNKLAKRNAELKQAEEKIHIDAPKVEYYEDVLTAVGTYTPTMLAKELDMRSAQALNKELIDRGIIYKRGSNWFLTADYTGNEYTTTKTGLYDSGYGKKTSTTRVWTEKGREFIHSLFKLEG